MEYIGHGLNLGRHHAGPPLRHFTEPTIRKTEWRMGDLHFGRPPLSFENSGPWMNRISKYLKKV
jgi:hypothetical protein